MNHAGAGPGLVRTYCGAEIGEGDRKLAAFIPETMAQLTCRICRRGLGLPVAHMRILGGLEDRPLEFHHVEDPGVHCVIVPGFGHLFVVKDPTHERAGKAVLTSGPGDMHLLDVKRIDSRIEIEMLHNEDRLCVVIEP